ncbi:MAG: prepilin-type N-terminal cleavage/methylation domain-containing protein [Candidatus Colwellbacteria bacterium]|nr:prepilin-type N-terminal cleavage/methylation domain-containing protein [Candidatus Colwellbacteria bacterium]
MATFTSSTSIKGEHRGRRGFTLIELVVVMAITAVLISMVLGYSKESTRQLVLTSTQAKMLSLINRAKFLSIETFFGGERSGDQRICSYGVRVDRSNQEIFIFQDLSSSAECPGNSNNVYDKGEELSGELNRVNLKDTVITFTENTTLTEVVFIPPDPKTKINNSGTTEARVEVKIREGKGQFTITVNNAGQIRTE